MASTVAKGGAGDGVVAGRVVEVIEVIVDGATGAELARSARGGAAVADRLGRAVLLVGVGVGVGVGDVAAATDVGIVATVDPLSGGVAELAAATGAVAVTDETRTSDATTGKASWTSTLVHSRHGWNQYSPAASPATITTHSAAIHRRRRADMLLDRAMRSP